MIVAISGLRLNISHMRAADFIRVRNEARAIVQLAFLVILPDYDTRKVLIVGLLVLRIVNDGRPIVAACLIPRRLFKLSLELIMLHASIRIALREDLGTILRRDNLLLLFG